MKSIHNPKLRVKFVTGSNSEILRQFEAKGLSINEGMAVDARLVESASRPLSNDELHPVK